MLRRFALLIVALACMTSAGWGQPAAAQQREIVVYSTADENTLAREAALFREQTGWQVSFVRLSAGEMVTRVIAERATPRADAVVGITTEHMLRLKAEGLLRPTAPPENAQFFPESLHDRDGHMWVYAVGPQGLLMNKQVFAEKFPGVPVPETWEDLLHPRYRGWIVMPDPLSSGTGYFFLTTHLLRTGTEDWTFMEQFVRNVDQYTASGAAPSRLTALGEYAFGVAFVHDALSNVQAGFPVEFIIPGPTGGAFAYVAAVANSPNPEGAEVFLNWFLSRDAQQLEADLQAVGSLHRDVTLPDGFPALDELEFVNVDPDWAATNRERLLRRWQEIVD